MMAETYTADDLYYTHYVRNIGGNGEMNMLDLDTTPLDLLEGNCVVLFANTFFSMYMPEHSIEDLYSLEFIFLHHLPPYITARNDIATWLAKNLKLLEVTRRTRLYEVT